MKKALFVDLTFHKETKSSEFILEVISKEYDIYFEYIDLKGKIIEKPKNDKFDICIFWQVFPEKKITDQINANKIVFFPMYDAVSGLNKSMWLSLGDTLIISFSKKLYIDLTSFGMNAKYIQYFPRPLEINNWGDEKSIFFWQRRNEIHVNFIKNLFRVGEIERIHCHRHKDPGQYEIEIKNNQEIEIEYSEWFADKEDMIRTIQHSSLYMAPRLYEGIGMSFLEAMAMGRCVIASDTPTMNEYITDGENGFLFDRYNLKYLEVSNIRNIQKKCYEYIKEGYKRWEEEKWTILKWIEKTEIEENSNFINFERNDKMGAYYSIFNKWLYLINHGINIQTFFKNKNIKNIVIYGYADFTKRLLEELDSEVVVKAIIDQKGGITEQGDKIYKELDLNMQIDAIIITATYYADEIRNKYERYYYGRIYSLDEIIDGLINYQ